MIRTYSVFDDTIREPDKPVEKPKESKSDLTPRQWALYRLIEHNSLVELRKTTQREICEKLKDYGYEWNDDVKAHDHCSTIWTDITENNLSYEHNKLIISKNFEYWIGSESETKDFIHKLWADLSPRLSRYWRYLKKSKKDGQGKIIDKNGNIIDETSKAEKFIEAFNEYDIEMKENK